MLIIDAHAHIFKKVNGKNLNGPVVSSGYGKIKNAGEEKPFVLPFCRETTFTSEMLVELMDRNNIQKAVLLQNPTIGTINDYILASVNKYPDRFVATMQVDVGDPRAVNEAASLAESKAFRALKLEMSQEWGWTGIYPETGYYSENVQHIIEEAVKSGLKIIIDTGPVGNPGYDIESLDKITSRYSGTDFLIEHLGYLRRKNLAESDDMECWKRLLLLGKKSNVYFGLSAVSVLLNDEYPCNDALHLIEQAVGLVGAKKVLWGTDIPITMRSLTCGQMKDIIIKHAGFLNDEEKELIMGRNAQGLFFEE